MKYDRIAFAAKHRAASYMALENPATKRLVMNILQNHADAVKEVHRLFEENERLQAALEEVVREREDYNGKHQIACMEIEKLSDILTIAGFRRCDIPACNCGSWHPYPDGWLSK